MCAFEATRVIENPGFKGTIMITGGPNDDELWQAFRGAWGSEPRSVKLSIMPGIISFATPMDQELRRIKGDWLFVNPLLDQPIKVRARILALAYEIENPAAGRSMIVELTEMGGHHNLLDWAHWHSDIGKLRKGACAYVSYNTMSATGGLALDDGEPLVNARIQIEQIHTHGYPKAYIIDGTSETWPVTRIFRRADLINKDPTH